MKWIRKCNKGLPAQKILESTTEKYNSVAAALLSLPVYREQLKELKALISITAENYELLYLKPLQAFILLFESLLESDEQEQWLLRTLEHIISALKLRRAYMLPLGADAETCYREQDLWTYAIFSAALGDTAFSTLQNFRANKDKTIQPAAFSIFIKIFLAEKTLAWLSQAPELFLSWWASMHTHSPLPNSILEILDQVSQQKIKE